LNIRGYNIFGEGLNLEFTIRTNKKEYQEYNGERCKIVSAHRSDGLVEVYVFKYQCLILLEMRELDD
jgi:hypothetical protein